MPKINFDFAKSILEEIKSEDTVTIIHDSDADGFCSAICFFDFCLDKTDNVFAMAFKRGVNFDNKKIRKSNLVIVLDLAPSQCISLLRFLSSKCEKILYVDHHPQDAETFLINNVYEYRPDPKYYFPTSRLAYELTLKRPLMALAGILGDFAHLYKENDDIIKKLLGVFGMSLEEFMEKVSIPIANSINYFSKEPWRAFGLLKTIKEPGDLEKIRSYSDEIEKEVEKFVEGFRKEKQEISGIYFYYFKPNHDVKGGVTAKISNEYFENIVILATPLKGNMVSLSIRNQSRKWNVAKIIQDALSGIEGASGGGHRSAAGGVLNESDLEILKRRLEKIGRNLDNYLI
ncbi:DHH family phosphoesterase [Candidatus Pacearchaeota archaeon]|nr:MAG: DHH family phosphoesterase [Candidatus Pacearchaeota archaeon]